MAARLILLSPLVTICSLTSTLLEYLPSCLHMITFDNHDDDDDDYEKSSVDEDDDVYDWCPDDDADYDDGRK